MSCICEDVTYELTQTCQKCKAQVTKLATDWERRSECPIHNRKDMMICGDMFFFCDSCVNAGWYSYAGTGGGDDLINDKTGERLRWNGKPIDEPESEEDSEPF